MIRVPAHFHFREIAESDAVLGHDDVQRREIAQHRRGGQRLLAARQDGFGPLKDGQLYCAQCEKRVIVVKEGETPAEAASAMAMSNLEATLMAKIRDIEKRINEEKDIDQLQKLSVTLNTLLENLEKVRKSEKR